MPNVIFWTLCRYAECFGILKLNLNTDYLLCIKFQNWVEGGRNYKKNMGLGTKYVFTPSSNKYLLST